MSNKIKEQQFYQWKQCIPEFQKIINQSLEEVKKQSIHMQEPYQYANKVEIIRKIIEEGRTGELEENEEFYDVFVYIIEERTNTSTLSLAKQFKQTFGQQIEYWINKINQWASLITFTSRLTIWNVSLFLRNFVNYQQSPIKRDSIYQWRTKIQLYINSVQGLIRRINRLRKTDNPYFVDQAFLRYYKQKNLLTTFLKHFSKQKTQNSRQSLIDQNTIISQNRFKPENKLFNYKEFPKNNEQSNNLSKKTKNLQNNNRSTLHGFFKLNKSQNSNVQSQATTDKQQRQIQMQKFRKIIQNIGREQHQPMQRLRQEIRQRKMADIQQQKRKQQTNMKQSLKSLKRLNSKPEQTLWVKIIESFDNAQFKLYPLSHFTHFLDPNDYFQYEEHMIGLRQQICFSRPFRVYTWINYYSNPQQLYQDLTAVSLDGSQIDDSSQSSQFSSQKINLQEDINTNSYFIDNRNVVTDQEIEGYENITAEDKMVFVSALFQNRKQWVADYKYNQGEDILKNFVVIPTYGNMMPYIIQGKEQSKINNKRPRNKQEICCNNDQQSKNRQTNNTDRNKMMMQQIQQVPQEQNSTTNFKSSVSRNEIQFRNMGTQIGQKQFMNNSVSLKRQPVKMKQQYMEIQILQIRNENKNQFSNSFEGSNDQIVNYFKYQPQSQALTTDYQQLGESCKEVVTWNQFHQIRQVIQIKQQTDQNLYQNGQNNIGVNKRTTRASFKQLLPQQQQTQNRWYQENKDYVYKAPKRTQNFYRLSVSNKSTSNNATSDKSNESNTVDQNCNIELKQQFQQQFVSNSGVKMQNKRKSSSRPSKRKTNQFQTKNQPIQQKNDHTSPNQNQQFQI